MHFIWSNSNVKSHNLHINLPLSIAILNTRLDASACLEKRLCNGNQFGINHISDINHVRVKPFIVNRRVCGKILTSYMQMNKAF